MTAEVRFDNRRYAELLSETLPKRIATEEENERALAVLAASFNRDDIAVEEEALVDLLTALVEDFEAKHYELPRTAPEPALRLLMEERGVQQLSHARTRRSILSRERDHLHAMPCAPRISAGERGRFVVHQLPRG